MYIQQKDWIPKYAEKHIKVYIKKINKQSNRKMVKGYKQIVWLITLVIFPTFFKINEMQFKIMKCTLSLITLRKIKIYNLNVGKIEQSDWYTFCTYKMVQSFWR